MRKFVLLLAAVFFSLFSLIPSAHPLASPIERAEFHWFSVDFVTERNAPSTSEFDPTQILAEECGPDTPVRHGFLINGASDEYLMSVDALLRNHPPAAVTLVFDGLRIDVPFHHKINVNTKDGASAVDLDAADEFTRTQLSAQINQDADVDENAWSGVLEARDVLESAEYNAAYVHLEFRLDDYVTVMIDDYPSIKEHGPARQVTLVFSPMFSASTGARVVPDVPYTDRPVFDAMSFQSPDCYQPRQGK